MQGRLNSLQRTMLQWNGLHPYNAVHVVRVSAAFEAERLRNAIKDTLETRGLTHLTLNRKATGYHYDGGPAHCEIKSIACGDGSFACLAAEIELQLNTAFVSSEPFEPFRFFVAPGSNAFSLGVVYFHALADAESVVLLLKDMVATYLGRTGPEAVGPTDLYPEPSDGLFRHSPWLLPRKLYALPALVWNLRRSCRPHYRDAQNLSNGFSFLSLDSADLRGLIEAGKSWDVTLNDLFLALLMKSVSPLASKRARTQRRQKLTVGCIVNIRNDLGVDRRQTFGLFLGSFLVTHEIPDQISLQHLASDIRRRTLAIKRSRLYLGTHWEMAFARCMLPLYSVERRKRLYQKHYPLWGGITNMNLNALWVPPDGERPLDYLRAVSTGPATPLVLSVTTVADHVNVGLTYRQTVFAAAEMEQVRSYILDLRQHLKGQA